ncbi:MAG: AMP-binding protein, partial [bacterium]|nr:AMP-binding protein [bacterium]
MIIKKFEEQVNRLPDKMAVVSEDQFLTYSELNRQGNRLANRIRQIAGDTGDNSRVALLFRHGLDMIVAIIGALKANRIYVPLDVTYPPKRLLYMLNHSGTRIIITNARNRPLAENLSSQTENAP